MTSVYAGTSGFSYKEWKGHFYPADVSEKDFLSFYGTQLNTVEINNTFYRMPRREVLKSWAQATPDNFQFIIKASRRITHFKRLKDAGEPMSYLLTNTAELGDKLGALLFQLPPNLRASYDRLASFVELVPEDVPAVIEFRHESWLDEKIFEVLRSKNIATCIVDDGEKLEEPVRTSDWCYARLRAESYSKAALKAWADYLAGAGYDRSYLYFKHETDGAGPLMAQEFLKSLSRRKTLEVA